LNSLFPIALYLPSYVALYPPSLLKTKPRRGCIHTGSAGSHNCGYKATLEDRSASHLASLSDRCSAFGWRRRITRAIPTRISTSLRASWCLAFLTGLGCGVWGLGLGALGSRCQGVGALPEGGCRILEIALLKHPGSLFQMRECFTTRSAGNRCPVNMEHVRQSTPDSGLGSQVKILKPFQVFSASLGVGFSYAPCVKLAKANDACDPNAEIHFVEGVMVPRLAFGAGLSLGVRV